MDIFYSESAHFSTFSSNQITTLTGSGATTSNKKLLRD